MATHFLKPVVGMASGHNVRFGLGEVDLSISCSVLELSNQNKHVVWAPVSLAMH
jgi:hypothetical protein